MTDSTSKPTPVATQPDTDGSFNGSGFSPANRDGSPSQLGPDDYTKQVAMARLNKPITTLVGNLADLHRINYEEISPS